jgi:hypothetical protein
MAGAFRATCRLLSGKSFHGRPQAESSLSRREPKLVLLFLTCTTSLFASEPMTLEQGIFGVAWGSVPGEITKRYPDAQEISPTGHVRFMTIKRALDFHGASVGFVMLTMGNDDQKLEAAGFSVPGESKAALLQNLIATRGQPQTITQQEGMLKSHVLEWVTPAFDLTISVATRGPSWEDPAFGDLRVQIRRGSVVESEIDKAKKIFDSAKNKK